MFRPFHRLDLSRNPRTGGIGLGLTVARDITRGMGGDIVLGESKLGGLRASLRVHHRLMVDARYDADLIEFICQENNQAPRLMIGK